ncbi:endonuclease V [Thermocrinis sp.]
MMDQAELERSQFECAKKVVQKDCFEKVELIGGIDLAFENLAENPTRAWACLVVVELKTLKPVYHKVVDGVVDFPYIPTFLAFREMPLMLRLYESAEVKPDLYFIDGQGVAHPRGCGIASHFGVETGEPTVGVAKNRLIGYYKELDQKRGSYSYLSYKGKVVGAVLRTKDNISPVYVSVGNKVSLNTAIELVLKTSIYRIPEPTRLAHNYLQRLKNEKTSLYR